MCKANDKLRLFSYALSKLIEIHKEKNGLSDTKKALCSFSNIRIMKLLYCLCLESLSKQAKDDIGLFKYFEHFYAYPYGPVLPDVYYAFDIVPGYEYEEGHFLDQTELVEIIDEQCKIKIDKAALGLKNNMCDAIFNSRDELIKLTHKLPLWKETFLYKTNREMSIEPRDLQREYDLYITLRNP